MLNSILGLVQEWRAEGALAALRQMAAPHARVLRDGREKDIPAYAVVPGDVLVFAVAVSAIPEGLPAVVTITLALFHWQQQQDGLSYSRTVAFCTIAAFQRFQAFNARSQFQSVFSIGLLSNRWLLLGLGTAVVLQVAVVQTPLGTLLFGTEPLAAMDWIRIVLVSSSIWIADEILKRIGVHGRRPVETKDPAVQDTDTVEAMANES